MQDSIETFKEQYPSLESYWRSIILFGRNVATYKFALAESLLSLAKSGKTVITLDELAVPYSRNLCHHIATAPKQATSQSSTFLEACKNYNDGIIPYQKLLDTTVSKGFNNVIDAFHTVNNAPIPVQFYTKDYTRNSKKIILTDEVFKLNESICSKNFLPEIESRWNLVETAWGLGISSSLLNIRYDDTKKILFIDEKLRRKDVTSARGALNGYQKGKCFYCFDDITVSEDGLNTCDVDHFFPHILQPFFPDVNLDGVWNLVLACPACNRGEGGKFARMPATKYLERLHRRNEFLIGSHHPLRETIIRQTGQTESERRHFLQNIDQRAIGLLIHRWEVPPVARAAF